MKKISDEGFIDMMDRVHLLTKKIFADDGIVMDNKEFKETWNRLFFKLNIPEKVKKNPYSNLVYYHNYLVLMHLEKASFNKIDDDLFNEAFAVKEPKVPYLRLVRS